jgi:hypothetical protein
MEKTGLEPQQLLDELSQAMRDASIAVSARRPRIR